MASASGSCRACQRRLFDSLASLAGLSIAATRQSTRPQTASAARDLLKTTRRRVFSATAFKLQDPQLHTEAQPFQTRSEAQQQPNNYTQPSNPPSSDVTTSDGHIPWYLRVSPPTPLAPADTTTANLAAQELPPLPHDPPPILDPILNHLSITIGLDHLTILDLRDLHPPSALGSNLLMILGTARSEKHLNTSADRFCRWLRSTYKLRPYADGLLGRNELKLKLRRRNKKLKLAQSVGNTTVFGGAEGKGYDDGITTGWICCNVGAVDGIEIGDVDVNEIKDGGMDVQSEKPAEKENVYPVYSVKDQERILEDEAAEYKNPSEEDFKYRGFGASSNAPRIVVQMFTEEKRLQMDLEGLWETRIKRRDEKAEKQDREFEEGQERKQEQELFDTSRIEDEFEGSKAREA